MPRTIAALFALLLATLGSSAVGQTETTADLVRWIYLSHADQGASGPRGIALLSAPDRRRQFFSSRMAAFFDANDSYGDDLAAACLDFGLEIPGNDFDAAEIARTLSVTTVEEPGRQTVAASFTTFGQPATIVYEFIPEGGGWRIDDIAGPGWRVSQIPCTPRSAAAPPVAAATSYCYLGQNDRLRLDVAPTGVATFSLESWQTNGHSCSGVGVAQPAGDRWIYRENFDSGPCTLSLAPTSDGGIRLSDSDHACKRYLCGQRAALDGLTFDAANRIDCARYPAQ